MILFDLRMHGAGVDHWRNLYPFKWANVCTTLLQESQCDVYKMTKHECRMTKEWNNSCERAAAQTLLVATGLWPVQTKLAFTRSERLTEPWLQNVRLWRRNRC